MRLIIFGLLVGAVSFLNFLTTGVYSQAFYFPMDRYSERIRVKNFGTLVDDAFYQGKEALFPFNRFFGHHAAVDLEIFGGEENSDVLVYAVTSGKIKYIGSLPGYGGLILQTIDGEERTALYGHVKITDLDIKVGDEVTAGRKLTLLGDGFSKETSRERKHLHFGIYKGVDLYFKGHEQTRELLIAKWEDPTDYLKQRGVTSVGSNQDNFGESVQIGKTVEVGQQSREGFFNQVINLIKSLFDKLR